MPPKKIVEEIVEKKEPPIIPPEKEVVVELDDKNQPIQAKEPEKVEPKYVTAEEFQKTQKAINYQSTVLRKLEDTLKNLNAPRATVPNPELNGKEDELDTLVQTDWKAAVKRLARDEAAELRKSEREAERVQSEQERTLKLLEDNKRKVIERHKELMDETSDKSQIFQEIISEHPEYLSNPFGPVLTMNEMENRLRADGKFVEPVVKETIDKEVARRARTGATSVTPSSGGGSSKSVTLTRDEREFCDSQGIKYEQYASMKSRTNQKAEGVEA